MCIRDSIITEFDPRKRRIIGNRKVLLVEQKAKQQEELLANLHVGDVIEGTVKTVTDFGAFIELGGVDGLLHISEMSWGRVENPKKVFTVGQTVRAVSYTHLDVYKRQTLSIASFALLFGR